MNDARRKWPNEIVVDLHEAELAIHRTDYAGAVDILRKSFKYYEDNWTESELNQSQRETMEHIGPSVYSLRGVAEFRISPESPEVHIVQFLITSDISNRLLCLFSVKELKDIHALPLY